MGNLAIFALVPLLMYFYVPFFRKLDVVTAYDYLEERFSPAVRVIGSLLFVLFHIGRIAVVIYLPTIAIASVTDIDPLLIACIVGVLSILYTFLGGIEGVIWADVIQGIILLAGAAVIIIAGVMAIDGGLGTVISDGAENGKFFSSKNWDFAGAAASSLPIIFLGQMFNALYQYTASQDVVQRYQTTADDKETTRSLLTNGLLALLTVPLFYGMGTMLFSYYRHAAQLPEDLNTSAIVPYFVVHALPAGISGLVLAAIFAAAQSTLSSSLNSISACITVDVWDRFAVPRGRAKASVGLARVIIIVAGLISVGVSLYLVISNQQETWDLFLAVMGLFGVPLAAVFALGIFSRRTRAGGVLIGLAAGAVAAGIVQFGMGESPLFVSTAGFVTTFVVGYLASLAWTAARGADAHDVTPLTVFGTRTAYTRRTRVEAESTPLAGA